MTNFAEMTRKQQMQKIIHKKFNNIPLTDIEETIYWLMTSRLGGWLANPVVDSSAGPCYN